MEIPAPAPRVRAPEHQAKLNRNLFGRNSGYEGTRANGENASRDEAFSGDLDPKYRIGRERPWHRTVINMSAAGYNNTEIAKAVGRSVSTVENTLRQPFAREYLIVEAKRTVQDEIRELLEGEVIPSLKALVAVRTNPEARSSDVINASNSILDRFLGKPTQPITTGAIETAEMSDAELRAQILAEQNAVKPN